MSFLIVIDEFRRVVIWRLMSDNTLELGAGIHWGVKNELNRLAFS